jgi:hypothetical protein
MRTPNTARRITCPHSTGTVCKRCFGENMLDHDGATYQFATAADLVRFTRERYDEARPKIRADLMAWLTEQR